MGADILHWFIIGFFFGLGFALSTWLLGRVLH